jgi:hypothetical protein
MRPSWEVSGLQKIAGNRQNIVDCGCREQRLDGPPSVERLSNQSQGMRVLRARHGLERFFTDCLENTVMGLLGPVHRTKSSHLKSAVI